MEARKILKILWRDKGLILGTTILAVVTTLFFALFQPPKYETNLDIEVKRINRPATEDYQYDEYYAIQSANLVTDTINSWFRNKNISRRILMEAGFDEYELPPLTRFVQNRKLSGQNLEIKIKTDSKKTAVQLAQIIEEFIKTRVHKLNVDENGQPTFKANINQGPIHIERIKIPYVLAAGLIGGLLIGIFLALVFYYFKK